MAQSILRQFPGGGGLFAVAAAFSFSQKYAVARFQLWSLQNKNVVALAPRELTVAVGCFTQKASNRAPHLRVRCESLYELPSVNSVGSCPPHRSAFAKTNFAALVVCSSEIRRSVSLTHKSPPPLSNYFHPNHVISLILPDIERHRSIDKFLPQDEGSYVVPEKWAMIIARLPSASLVPRGAQMRSESGPNEV